MQTGASNLFSCEPCAYGFFNNKLGATYCKFCPATYSCPLGCDFPAATDVVPENSNYQPLAYVVKKSSETSDTASLIWILCFSFIVIVIFLSLALRSIRNNLSVIDLFTKNHLKELDTPIMYTANQIGVIFSLVFIFIAMAFILTGALSYVCTNVKETKSLIPLVLVEENVISSSLQAVATFYQYDDNCVIENECVSANVFIENGITYS